MQEELDLSDGSSNPSMDILHGAEERFSFKTLLFPDNPEPSRLSGFTVNVCASVMGRCSNTTGDVSASHILLSVQRRIQWFQNKSNLQNNLKTMRPSAGILVLAFSVLAVQGGTAVWNIIALTVIFMVCLLFVVITWRQPESKTKLSFKV